LSLSAIRGVGNAGPPVGGEKFLVSIISIPPHPSKEGGRSIHALCV